MKKFVLFILMLSVVMCLGCVYAGTDMVPPTGSITIQGATLRDGVYYVQGNKFKLFIHAQDDVSPTANLEMILSHEPISEEFAADDRNWLPYASSGDWTAENENVDENIYLYLRDEAR